MEGHWFDDNILDAVSLNYIVILDSRKKEKKNQIVTFNFRLGQYRIFVNFFLLEVTV